MLKVTVFAHSTHMAKIRNITRNVLSFVPMAKRV